MNTFKVLRTAARLGGAARSATHAPVARSTLARRAYSTPSAQPAKSNKHWVGALIGGGIGLGLAYYVYSPTPVGGSVGPIATTDIKGEGQQHSDHAPWKKVDYNQVYKDIAEVLEENAEDYDDGSFGPVILRLAWHSSGTFSKADGTGGSNGATMRYAPEANHGANNGLGVARQKLEKIKAKYPDLSYSDLWTLAGVVAIQEAGGPQIPWRPGRADASENKVIPDGRLPDASKKQDHVRDIFYRMGFNDQEIVALVGAHAMGRCHPDRSGYDGPWDFSPTTFSNEFFNQLLNQEWVVKKWDGPMQYVDKPTGSIMMLPADMAIKEDKEFRKWAELYAKDEKRFFDDFSKAFSKLIELGVPFPEDSPVIKFQPL
ncbi:heme peroxidase [Tieghemiomyces parasiticus]|uniref:Peroxidase n=1 Tax=Tieghemiomyces parasiticus TaxID=78921 RepID=A0A9W7ZMN8_9FUNG|nr:heme peroxidase [Tieghemiomyces parasiticus]